MNTTTVLNIVKNNIATVVIGAITVALISIMGVKCHRSSSFAGFKPVFKNVVNSDLKAKEAQLFNNNH